MSRIINLQRIKNDLYWRWRILKQNIILRIRNLTYKFDDEYLNYTNYCSIHDNRRQVKMSVFNPVLIVWRTLEEVFPGRLYPEYIYIGIMGIEVNTQNKDAIEVTITAKHPGKLIGEHGQIFDKISNILTNKFGRNTKINIKELSDDINDWSY